MTTSVFTTCYRDQDAFAEFCDCFDKLDPKPNVYVMGFPDDPCKPITLSYGFTYLDNDHNLPLGKKNNDCIEAVMKIDPADHFLYMGADNVINQKLWTKATQTDADLFGILDIYFYDGNVWYFGGYTSAMTKKYGYTRDRTGEPLGPCKRISRKLLEKMPRPWNDGQTKSTDFDMWNNLLPHSQKTELLRLGSEYVCIDIKSGQDLTPISRIPLVPVDKEQFFTNYPNIL
jgi:hypothetical protein